MFTASMSLMLLALVIVSALDYVAAMDRMLAESAAAAPRPAALELVAPPHEAGAVR